MTLTAARSCVLLRSLVMTVGTCLIVTPAAAQLDPPTWTKPVAPFRIVGNIWYVGTEGLAAYLIKTPAGGILIDATVKANVPAIERNIAAVGVAPRRVRYLLVTHAHFDHVEGDAAMRRDTGAQVIAGARDVRALERGRPEGDNAGPVDFPPVRVARGVREGDRVTLGGATLTAHATPGHTPGCTTWSTDVVERGRRLRIVFPCSLSVAGNRLVGNSAYPDIVADYRASFAKLAAMPADVMLPAHPEFADVLGRARRAAAGQRNAFVAPRALARWTEQMREAFDAELARQRAAR